MLNGKVFHNLAVLLDDEDKLSEAWNRGTSQNVNSLHTQIAHEIIVLGRFA